MPNNSMGIEIGFHMLPNLSHWPPLSHVHPAAGTLAKAGVNIAHFALGRHHSGGEALGVLTVDQQLSQVRS